MITPHTHDFHPSILREYDIRGIVGETLHEIDAYFLGKSFGTFVKRKFSGTSICVGYDGRLTSEALHRKLVKGLIECGLDVISIGLGPSPMLYFSVKHLNADAGIMITGSHNPANYNGFKMSLNKAPVFGAMIQTIGEIAKFGDFETGTGTHKNIDVKDIYIQRLLQDFTCTRPLKIAWDAGHGAAGDILQALVKHLPGEHILLYETIDGTFPAHHPDPTVDENLIDLQAVVKEHGCDLGIAFDGDGDRIGVVDEKCNILRCDILMTIYAREVLKNHPGAAIIGDVKCSQVMFDAIESMGGQSIIWKTGHSLIKSKMADLNAPLAGELSGHIFFADHYYGYDDALYCAIRLLNTLQDADGGLSSLTSDLPKLYNTPEIRVEVDDAEKFDLVPRIIELIRNDNPECEIDTIDGLRIKNDDGWWLARPSNTQNALALRMESHSKQGLENLKTQAVGYLRKIGYDLKT